MCGRRLWYTGFIDECSPRGSRFQGQTSAEGLLDKFQHCDRDKCLFQPQVDAKISEIVLVLYCVVVDRIE